MDPNAPAGSQPDPYANMGGQGGGGKKFSLPSINLSGKAKLPVLIGGGFLLLILIWMIIGLLSRPPENAQILTTVAEQQARILQAAEEGVDKARSQDARNLAVTVQFSLTGDQKPLLDALKGQNIRVSPKDDEDLEQELILAEQNNRFDRFVADYLEAELASYVQNLARAYESTEDPALREVLEAQYENARFLSGDTEEIEDN